MDNQVLYKLVFSTLQLHFWLLLLLSCFSHVWLFATLRTIAHQTLLSMGFSRQEYWSGLPCPPPGHLPDPGTDPCLLSLLHWQASSLSLVPSVKPHISDCPLLFSLTLTQRHWFSCNFWPYNPTSTSGSL